MLRRFILAAILFCQCAQATSCLAQEAQRSWWNPLGLIKEKPVKDSNFFNNIQASDVPASEEEMVKPASAWFPVPTMKKPKFTALKKFGNSTKSFFSKTADIMNPFDGGGEANETMPRDQGYKPQMEKEKKPKGRFFSWLWEKPPEEPHSVNDWLSQDNPLLDAQRY